MHLRIQLVGFTRSCLHNGVRSRLQINGDPAVAVGRESADFLAVLLRDVEGNILQGLARLHIRLYDEQGGRRLVFDLDNDQFSCLYLDRARRFVPMIAFQTFDFRNSVISLLQVGNANHAVLVGLEIADFFAIQLRNSEGYAFQRRMGFTVGLDDLYSLRPPGS